MKAIGVALVLAAMAVSIGVLKQPGMGNIPGAVFGLAIPILMVGIGVAMFMRKGSRAD